MAALSGNCSEPLAVASASLVIVVRVNPPRAMPTVQWRWVAPVTLRDAHARSPAPAWQSLAHSTLKAATRRQATGGPRRCREIRGRQSTILARVEAGR